LGGEIGPFLSFGWLGLDVDSFSERGGLARLASRAESKDTAFSHAGLKFSTPVGSRLTINTELGWKHLYGNLKGNRIMSFQAGGHKFAINGVLPNRNELTVGVGGGLKIGEMVSVNLKYEGLFGSKGHNNSGSIALNVNF
jgi:outer membrane autotransporter protein